MSNIRLYQVLKAIILKSQRLEEEIGAQVYKVDSNATKREIKEAVELMFEGVEVLKK